MSLKINISKIIIRNILGIESVEFDTGKLTTITGKNGTGKSSIIKAIASVFKGGHDATLIKKGAESGEIVFVLSDKRTVTKKVTKKGSELKVSGESKPQSYLDSITDLVSVNPVSFLLGDDKEQLRILLESIPIVLPTERLEQIYGRALPFAPPLVVLDSIRKEIYDNRTGSNRMVKQKQATITELEGTLTPFSGDEFVSEKLQLEREKLDGERKGCQFVRQTLKEQLDADIQKLRDKYDSDIENNRIEEQSRTTPIVRRIAELESAEKAEEVSNRTLTLLNGHRIELLKYQEESKQYDESLNELDGIKQGLLSNTPFKGLSISEGKIYINGIYFNQMNTASRIGFVVKMAELRAGEMGLVCLDGMESLDANTLSYFALAILHSKLQFFITKVADTGLTITSK